MILPWPCLGSRSPLLTLQQHSPASLHKFLQQAVILWDVGLWKVIMDWSLINITQKSIHSRKVTLCLLYTIHMKQMVDLEKTIGPYTSTHLSPGFSLPALIFWTRIGWFNKQLNVAAFLRICPPWTNIDNFYKMFINTQNPPWHENTQTFRDLGNMIHVLLL